MQEPLVEPLVELQVVRPTLGQELQVEALQGLQELQVQQDQIFHLWMKP